MKLRSGREINGNRDLFSPGEDDGTLFDGYDGVVEESLIYDRDWPEASPPLTAEERQDIADQMIERWRRWAVLGNAKREY